MKTKIKFIAIYLVAAFAAFSFSATDLLAQGKGKGKRGPAKRSIVQVKGDVYLFKNNFHHAMFVVTNDGIVVTDPINAGAVGWLKAELKKRFNKPVTHMIYSHFHGDHNTGGQAWGGGLEIISHENTKGHVAAGRANTAMPTKTFKDTMTFSTGGKTFELKYLGKGHSDDLITTVVRPENVAFVVDAVSPKRLPFRDFARTDIGGMINQIKVIESLDFDILAPGHSVVATKQDATDMRVYTEKLMAAVTKELKAGKSEAEILQSVKMEEYKGWGAYKPFLPLNIKGMIRWLKANGKV